MPRNLSGRASGGFGFGFGFSYVPAMDYPDPPPSSATAWPYPWTQTSDKLGIGSSTMNGGEPTRAPAPMHQIGTDGGATYYKEGDTIPGSGPPVAVINWGVGNYNSTNILKLLNGVGNGDGHIQVPARGKAAYTIAQLGGVYETGTLPIPGIMTNTAAILTALGHSNVLFVNKHNDAVAVSGSADWHRLRELNRQYVGVGYLVSDASLFFRLYNTGDPTDDAAKLTDVIAPSLDYDTAHLNGTGNTVLAKYVYEPWVESKEASGLPFIPHRRYFSGDASANQVNNGLVCTIVSQGDLTGCTVAVNDADFKVAIESGAIKLRRNNGNFISDGYRNITVTITRGNYYRDSFIQVYIGDFAPAGLYRANLNSQWLVREGPIKGVGDTQKLSIALGYKANTSVSTSRGIFGTQAASTTAGLSVALKNSANQNVGLVSRNSSDAIVLNLDSPTGTGFTLARGLQWYFASVDLTAAGGHTGGGLAKVAIDANAATTTGGTATLGGTMRIFPPSLTNILNLIGATTAAGAGVLDGEIAALWLASDYVDFGPITGNRDLVRNAANKRSVLGTTRGGDTPGLVNGISPFYWCEGGAGNWAGGINLADVDMTNLDSFWDCTDRAAITSVAA